MAEVKLNQVCKSYGTGSAVTEVIKNVSLSIDDGEFVVFVGPSGCGKSTLLRLIAGLTDVTSGEVSIGSRVVNKVPPAERKIAMVFQSYALYPHMSVAENMGFSLRMAKEAKESIDAKVLRAAKILQLDKLLARKPKALSGGQRQRVAIGRAIVREPEVFLFDEPLSNLDAELRVDMRVQITKIHQQLKTTMIYVTHDQVEAMTMADKIVVLRDGYLQQVGSPLGLYHYPENQFVAGFIGSPKMNFLQVKCTGASAKAVAVEIDGKDYKLALAAAPQQPGAAALGELAKGKLTLGVRPKHININQNKGIKLSGEVEVVERLGGISYAYVKLDGKTQAEGNLVVEIADDTDLGIGKKVKLSVDPGDCYLFTDQGVALKRLGAYKT